MPLAMSRPWPHPDTGIFWFRKRVPDDLRNLVQKSEERFSLRTRDPREAKRLHALKLAEVEERWANLRAGERPSSQDDVTRHAATIGDYLRRQVEADPYSSFSGTSKSGQASGLRATANSTWTPLNHCLQLIKSELIKRASVIGSSTSISVAKA